MELLQVTIATNTVAYTVIGLLMAILGFFMRNLHGEVKDTIAARITDREEMGKLKGKIELTEQHSQLEIKAITKSMDNLTDEVREMNREFKTKHDDLVKIFQKLTEGK